jgi:hypothetical protein
LPRWCCVSPLTRAGAAACTGDSHLPAAVPRDLAGHRTQLERVRVRDLMFEVPAVAGNSSSSGPADEGVGHTERQRPAASLCCQPPAPRGLPGGEAMHPHHRCDEGWPAGS